MPADKEADVAAERLTRSTVGAMRLVRRDVPIEVSAPSASYVMSKDVEAIRDPEGRLVPWTFTQDIMTSPVNI